MSSCLPKGPLHCLFVNLNPTAMKKPLSSSGISVSTLTPFFRLAKRLLPAVLFLTIHLTAAAQDDAARLHAAAERGDAAAQYSLGDSYCWGFSGVAKDWEKAFYWYQKSALQGFGQAQYMLGFCYFFGEGTAENKEQGFQWFRKAAQQGDAQAQYKTGCCYQNADGTARDFGKALYWFRKSAEQKYAEGQRALGGCYALGIGTAVDKPKAFYYYRLAAEQGDADAQYLLGCCYRDGEGTAADETQAVNWFRKSAEQGNSYAKKWLEEKEITDRLKLRYAGVNVLRNPKNATDIYYAVISDEGRIGVCDQTGREIVPTKYTSVTYTGDEFILKAGDKVGVCETSGREVLAPVKYTDILVMPHYYRVMIDDRIGVCSLYTGEEIVPCSYFGLFRLPDPAGDVYFVKERMEADYIPFKHHLYPCDKSKVLTAEQRKRCLSDIDYAGTMAQAAYAEAEFIYAELIRSDKKDQYAKYREHWSKYDPKDNTAGAVYWYKQACEHGWAEAYMPYALFCFEERGGAEGGIDAAKKWIESAQKAEPNNWISLANAGAIRLIDDDSSNDLAGLLLLRRIVLDHPKERWISRVLGLACYYGIGVAEDKTLGLEYLKLHMNAEARLFDHDATGYYFIANAIYHGIGGYRADPAFVRADFAKQGDAEAAMKKMNDCVNRTNKQYLSAKKFSKNDVELTDAYEVYRESMSDAYIDFIMSQ